MMFEKFLTDKQVEKHYSEAGRIFGNAVSYIYLGEYMGFKKMLAIWEKWEAEYAKRGYRTLPVDDFVDSGGYGKALEGLGVKRAEGEQPFFHAKFYRETYLGKIKPEVNLAELMRPAPPNDKSQKSRTQTGTYFVPSSKNPNSKETK